MSGYLAVHGHGFGMIACPKLMDETLRVLVIDDNEADRMTVRHSLKATQLAIELMEATSCTEAIATLQHQAFDCAILNDLLPDGNGLSLVQRIRQAQFKLALIVLADQGDEQIAVELMKAGASDYLLKAKVSADSLARALRNAIRLNRAEIEAAQAAEQLRTSEERYRFVLEGANDGIWDWDIRTNTIYCNDRLFEILGRSRPAHPPTLEFFARLCHPDDSVRVFQALKAHLKNWQDYNVELRLQHSSGEYRYCIARGKAQRSPDGIPRRMSGVLSDITERKRAEEAQRFVTEAGTLLATSLNYETTLENLAHLTVPYLADWCTIHVVRDDQSLSQVAVAHKDPQKAQWLHDLQERYPLNPDEPYGIPEVARTGCVAWYPQMPEALLSQVARNPEHLAMMQNLEFHSAMCLPLLARGRTLGVMTLSCGESRGVYSQVDRRLAEELAHRAALAVDNARLYRQAQDIGEHLRQAVLILEEREERLEAQNSLLLQQNIELEQHRQRIQAQNLKLLEAAQLKSQFLATMSHELRTPMNAIMGFSQLLLRQQHPPLPNQQADMVRRILKNGKNLLVLINDILDLSKIEAGRLELKREPLNLVHLVITTTDELRALAERKCLALQVTIHVQNPYICNDARRLRQVLINLISNAIKFTEIGEVQVEVMEPSSETLRIAIHDTGIGISETDLPHIFEEFRQVDQALTKKYPGTGLGLAITDWLVRMMNGSITVTSQLGHGSTFQIELPRHSSGSS